MVKGELEKKMKPEILNRIDEIVVFKPLEDRVLLDITRNMLDDTGKRTASEQDMDVSMTDALARAVADKGAFSAETFGARPVRRAAKQYLEDTLSEAIMRSFLNEGDGAVVDVAGGEEAGGFRGDGRRVVKVTQTTEGMRESMLIPVDGDSGIGGRRSERHERVGPADAADGRHGRVDVRLPRLSFRKCTVRSWMEESV